MSESWQLDHDGWSEIWSRSMVGSFDQVSTGDRRFDLARDDLNPLRARTADGCEVCRAALPQAFSFCFACGARLRALAGPGEPCQSSPNGTHPHAGLPRLEPASGPIKPERVALPQIGRHFALAVAGDPARLLAVDRDGGWAHEYDRRRQHWTRLFRVGENHLPGWSWSAAASATGIVMPADNRIALIDLTRGPLAQPEPTTLPLGDQCAGGACLVQDEAMLPVRRGGLLHLARRRMLRGAEWSIDPVQDAPAWADASALAAPMVTEGGASWAGETGFVLAELDDSGKPGPARWRGWEDGFTPLLANRPFVDPDSSVWQFGSVPATKGTRRTYCLARVGGRRAEIERLENSVLTSGVLACRLLTLRSRAWREENYDNRTLAGNDDDFLVPVQALSPGSSVLLTASGIGRLGELFDGRATEISPPITAYLRFCSDWMLHDLGMPIDLGSLAQLAAIVFDGQLYVYDAAANECWRWALRPAKS